jgi:hypothetical protein
MRESCKVDRAMPLAAAYCVETGSRVNFGVRLTSSRERSTRSSSITLCQEQGELGPDFPDLSGSKQSKICAKLT